MEANLSRYYSVMSAVSAADALDVVQWAKTQETLPRPVMDFYLACSNCLGRTLVDETVAALNQQPEEEAKSDV